MITIHKQFRAWYKDRALRKKWIAPDPPDALLWLSTEVGETIDAYMRSFRRHFIRNNPKDVKEDLSGIAKELCDVICMALAAATAWTLIWMRPWRSFWGRKGREWVYNSMA